MSDLRSIGTEFWGEPWASMTSGDSALRRYLLQVVSHDLCQTPGGTQMLEGVKAIRSQRQECIGLKFAEPGQVGFTRIFDGIWKDEP